MKTSQPKSQAESTHSWSPNSRNETFFSFNHQNRESFFRPATIQPKLEIGAPGDKYEQEADRVADAVVGSSKPSLLQRQVEEDEEEILQMQHAGEKEEELKLQRKCADCEQEKQIQKKKKDEDRSEYGIKLKSAFESGESPPKEEIQRKCACGDHKFAGGECAECSKKKRLGLQTKLKVNEPVDVYEREADWVADQVMATTAHPGVSGAPPRIQRFSGQSTGKTDAAPVSVEQVLASPGRPLEPALRQDMERRFGYDFSRVRVHTGAAAEQSARDVNAHAYTVGHNVVFGTGRYSPHTAEGQHLLAHELTHVVQQRYATPSDASIPVDADARSEHEREADAVTAKLGESAPVSVRGRSSAARLQRKTSDEWAGGCGLCWGRAARAGQIAHVDIQIEWMLPQLLGLVPLPANIRFVELPLQCRQNPRSRPRPDLVLSNTQGNLWFIGSIKPASKKHYRTSKEVFKYYRDCIGIAYPGARVRALRIEIPLPGMPFPNPRMPGECMQKFRLNPADEWGMYGYYCSPGRRVLQAVNPACRCGKQKKKPKDKKPKGTRRRAPRVRPRSGGRTRGMRAPSGGGALRGGAGLLNLLSLFEAYNTIQDAKAHLDAMFGPYQALWDKYEKQLSARNQGKNTATAAQPTPPLPPQRPEPEPPQKPPENETRVRLFEITRSRLSEREASVPSASIGTSYFPVEFFSLTRPGKSTFSIDASQIDCSRIHKGIVGVSGYQRYTGYARARNVNELNKLLGLQIGFAQLGCAMSGRGPQPAAQPDGDEISVKLTLLTSGESVTATCKKLAGASESTCTSEGNFASMKALMDDPELEVPPDFALEVTVVRTREGESQRSDRTISVWVENPDHPAPEPSVQADGSVPTDASEWKAYPSGSEIAYLLELYSRWGP